MTKLSAFWTYIRAYNLLTIPAAVGIPVAVAFLAVGTPTVHPATTTVASAAPAGGGLHVVADWPGPDAAPISTRPVRPAPGDPGAQPSGHGTTAQVNVVTPPTAANQVIASFAGMPGSGSPSAAGRTTIATVPSSSGAGVSPDTNSASPSDGSSTVQHAPNLPSLATDVASAYSIRATTATQPVPGSSTPQQVQVWVATPRATTSGTTTDGTTTTTTTTTTTPSLVDQLAAAGYNVSGIFSPANPPQLIDDYKPYVDAGVSPSYAYGAGSVTSDVAAIFTHLGFTLMKDVDTNDQYWVGPELALDPEFVPVPAS